MDYVYIDGSNFLIEAQRVSAVSTGLAKTIFHAQTQGIFDNAYRIDFSRLFSFLVGVGGKELARVTFFGSQSSTSESCWHFARKAGFELILNQRTHGKEKKVDTAIATHMTKDAYKHGRPGVDKFVLVAGDKDYVPPVSELTKDAYVVQTLFWDHAADELKKAATEFLPVNDYLDYLRLVP